MSGCSGKGATGFTPLLQKAPTIRPERHARFSLLSYRKPGCSGKGVTGFTLIEIMIALVVLLIVFLGLMQGVLVSIDTNMRNVLREEAINIAQTQMNGQKDIMFVNLNAGTTTATVLRNFRNVTNFAYTAATTVTVMDLGHKQVVVTVSWTWKGQTYNYSKTGLADSNYWNL